MVDSMVSFRVGQTFSDLEMWTYRPLFLHDLGPSYGVSGLDHETAR
jgi:hypothetical protein